MFIVRIMRDDTDEPDYKVFDSKAKAFDRYGTAVQACRANYIERAELFQIEGLDLRAAVDFLKSDMRHLPKGATVEMLRQQDSDSRTLEQIDLSTIKLRT
jgi:hypothetical protein